MTDLYPCGCGQHTVTAQDRGRRTPLCDLVSQPVEEVAEATAEAPKASSPPATHALYAAFEALESAARHLSAQDVAYAEAYCWHEVAYRPLTRLCGEAAAGLRDYIAEQIGLVTGEHVGLGHDTPVTTLHAAPEVP